MSERVADTLILTFTTGMSLELWQRGGVLAREWALYQALGDRYRRVLLVTYGSDADQRLALLAHAGGAKVQIICNAERPDDTPFDVWAAEEAARLTAGDRSVVVKTNQMDGGEVALAITRRLRTGGLIVGLIARGGYCWSEFAARQAGPQSATSLNCAAREGALCRSADIVVGSSQRMVDALTWRHGLSPTAARLIPNYVLPDAAPDPATPREPGHVLCAGRLEPQKRMDLLIDAVALARAAHPHVRLTIVGEGPQREDLERQAKRAGVAAEFLGKMDHAQLLSAMRRCEVYAQVSEYEGHPKTVIEAQACGCAVLVTDSPGLSDVVRNAETGAVVDHDAPSVATELVRLLNDAALRDSLGRAASKRVHRICGLERVVELEAAAHRDALRLGAEAATRITAPAPVRWEPDLLQATVPAAVAQWAKSIQAFTARLSPRRRAEFLMALDEPLYALQGTAAIDANGGLHPKHHLMRYHDFFVDRIAPGERVLDLGSGVGAVACSIAARSGAGVVGVEIEQANIAAAERRARDAGVESAVTFVRGDITQRRIEGHFDVIVLSNVLEHVRQRPALLRMWSEWYQPARILIRVPAFDRDWRTPWKRELGLEWRLDDTHEIEYTLESLHAEMAEAGLTVREQVANWGEYWIVAIDASRVEAAA